MSDWWAKKLGTQPPAPARGIRLPPVQTPQPVQHQQAPLYPQEAQQAAFDPVTGKQLLLDPNRPADAEVNMGAAMRLWKGGQAHRMEGNMTCPSCGSATGYTAYSSVSGQRPRPHCFECGYNGHFTQGLESSWA